MTDANIEAHTHATRSHNKSPFGFFGGFFSVFFFSLTQASRLDSGGTQILASVLFVISLMINPLVSIIKNPGFENAAASLLVWSPRVHFFN